MRFGRRVARCACLKKTGDKSGDQISEETIVMSGPFPYLFEPISLGRHEAKNRIMRVATTANLADRNRAGERLVEFYRTLAKGGVGSIVT